jgi:hypothetical protein
MRLLAADSGAGCGIREAGVWPVPDRSRILREHLSAERFAACCDRLWSTDRRSSAVTDRVSSPRHGSLLYAKQDHTGALFPRLERRRSRVVLVTAESDASVGPDGAPPPQVASWFAVNANCRGVEALPLGLGNSYCRVTTKADVLAAFAGAPKSGFLYANFRVETNPASRIPLWERLRCADWRDAVTFPQGELSTEEYARALASHRFVLCPAGNGTDTHRMWEALYAGTIPVVEIHPALESFRDLPILFVEKLADIVPGQLEAAYGEMVNRRWNCEKLFLPWWRERFESARRVLRQRVGWLPFLHRQLLRLLGSS